MILEAVCEYIRRLNASTRTQHYLKLYSDGSGSIRRSSDDIAVTSFSYLHQLEEMITDSLTGNLVDAIDKKKSELAELETQLALIKKENGLS